MHLLCPSVMVRIDEKCFISLVRSSYWGNLSSLWIESYLEMGWLFYLGRGVVLGFLPGELILLLQCLPTFPLTVNWLCVCLYVAKVVPQQITHTSPRIQSDYTAERSNLIPLSSHRASPNPVAMETRNDNRWGDNSSMNESVRESVLSALLLF